MRFASSGADRRHRLRGPLAAPCFGPGAHGRRRAVSRRVATRLKLELLVCWWSRYEPSRHMWSGDARAGHARHRATVEPGHLYAFQCCALIAWPQEVRTAACSSSRRPLRGIVGHSFVVHLVGAHDGNVRAISDAAERKPVVDVGAFWIIDKERLLWTPTPTIRSLRSTQACTSAALCDLLDTLIDQTP